MRIRLSDLETWRARDIRTLVDGTYCISRLSASLAESGVSFANLLVNRSESIDTCNYTAAKQHMIEYLRKANGCFIEMHELYDSAIEYANILARKWGHHEFAAAHMNLPSFNINLLESGTRNAFEGRVDDVALLRDSVMQANVFMENVTEFISSMGRQASGLGDVWRDPQYDQFVNYVEDVSSKILRDAEMMLLELVEAFRKEIGK